MTTQTKGFTGKIQLNTPLPHSEWQAYVQNHPWGTLYHLPQWKEVLEECFHQRPFYLFATDEESKLRGMLPLFQVKSILTGNRLVCLPFSHICGPLADSEDILKALVDKATELCQSLGCSYLELRMIASPEDSARLLPSLALKPSGYFLGHLLELSEPSKVWKKLDQKSVRWAITKAKKDGVTVRLGTSSSDLASFLGIYHKHKKALGVPAHPFIPAIFKKLPHLTRLYLAEIGGKVIAGILTLSFKDTVLYIAGASDNLYLKHHPYNSLLWTAIEDSCKQGYKYFDLGKTSPEDEGLARFKRHWGTEEKKLQFYYYPSIPSMLTTDRGGAKYRIVKALWSKMPLFLTKRLSPLALRHLH